MSISQYIVLKAECLKSQLGRAIMASSNPMKRLVKSHFECLALGTGYGVQRTVFLLKI